MSHLLPRSWWTHDGITKGAHVRQASPIFSEGINISSLETLREGQKWSLQVSCQFFLTPACRKSFPVAAVNVLFHAGACYSFDILLLLFLYQHHDQIDLPRQRYHHDHHIHYPSSSSPAALSLLSFAFTWDPKHKTFACWLVNEPFTDTKSWKLLKGVSWGLVFRKIIRCWVQYSNSLLWQCF